MPPQQNSTLIDTNLVLSPTNSPEEIKRYSPILPPKNSQIEKLTKNNKFQANANDKLGQLMEQPKKQPEKKQHPKSKQYRNGSNRGGRSRSISLSGTNSKADQGKEIPIWIGDEPRYVSGVTNKTTCNDIIRALIDDEVQNGNYAYCKRTNDGGAASRDYSDYVITESWRGIERSYDGNMAILPVWKAWSRVHNELRLSLKHCRQIQEPQIGSNQSTSGFSTLRRYFSKLLRFKSSKKAENPEQVPEQRALRCLLSSKTQIPDELLFVILPDTQYILKEAGHNEMEQIRSKNFKSAHAETAKLVETKLFKDKLYKLAETKTSIRKRRSTLLRRKDRKTIEKRRTHTDSNSCIRRHKDTPDYSSLRQALALKTCKMDELYAREYTLSRELSNKCKQYKLQNALYNDPQKQLELSVGQIQQSVETYAQEIVRTEHKLLELKNEIKEDISIINNLKRMTLERNGHKCDMPNGTRADIKWQETEMSQLRQTTEELVAKSASEQKRSMQFVDNIYEFCDNNASMLV